MLSADQLLPGQAAWVALPSAHHGKIKLTGPLSSSWASQDANQGQHSSFLPHLSVLPLLQYRCTVHSHLCGTQNTWHPRGNIVKEDPKSFLLSSYLGPAPLATSWYSHNGSPFHSLLLIELVHVCLYLPARGTGVEQIIWQQNKCGFLPFYCSMHTCNLTHSVFLIWY